MVRGGRGKAEEKRREVIAAQLLAELQALGARPTAGKTYHSLDLDTTCGLLGITVDLHQSGNAGSFASVFTRFVDPELAKHKLAVPCNPYSGKWNFHAQLDTRDKASVDLFVRVVVLSIKAIALPKEQSKESA